MKKGKEREGEKRRKVEKKRHGNVAGETGKQRQEESGEKEAKRKDRKRKENRADEERVHRAMSKEKG